MARNQLEESYARFNDYTRQLLKKKIDISNFPVQKEFQTISSEEVTISLDSMENSKLKRINILDIDIQIGGKVFTLLIRPDYGLNLPLFSFDLMCMREERLYIMGMRIIEPINNENSRNKFLYDRMRECKSKVEHLPKVPILEWEREFLKDCSIRVKGNITNESLFIEIFQGFLESYLEMVNSAERMSNSRSKEGFEKYVNKLLENGSSAVSIFKKILGDEKYPLYIKNVIFGLD